MIYEKRKLSTIYKKNTTNHLQYSKSGPGPISFSQIRASSILTEPDRAEKSEPDPGPIVHPWSEPFRERFDSP